MKDLLSILLEAAGKWFSKMLRGNPRAFLAGLSLGLIVLVGAGYVLLSLIGAKPHVVWVPGRAAKELSPSQYPSTARHIEDFSNSAERTISYHDGLAKTAAENKVIKIEHPSDGESVPETVLLRGVTAFPSENHYVLVTPETSGEFLQDGRLNVSADGYFVGAATIGNAAVGMQQKFMVRVFATKTVLATGSPDLPADAIFSETITLYRK